MDEPDRPVHDRDRDAAIRSVESAWADGQIVEVDRDERVDELRRAETMREVEMLVHDLRPAAYERLPAAPVVRTPRTTRVPRIVTLLVALGFVAVVGAAVLGIAAAIGGAVDSPGDAVTDSPTLAPGVEPGDDEVNLFSRGGYDELLGDLTEGVGHTEVFNAVLYPTYAVLDLPVDATSQRERSYYWNGELDEPGSKGTADETRYDLQRVDIAVVIGLVEQVRSRVEDPTSWYAILHAPREGDGSVLQVYASNDYDESAYVLATADGTVTYRSDPSS